MKILSESFWKYFADLYSGRVNRRTYIVGLLLSSLIFIIISMLSPIVMSSLPVNYYLAKTYVAGTLFFVLAWVVYIYSLHIRRLHDRGHSGWWVLLLPIDIWLNLLVKGDARANMYGEPPPKEIVFLNWNKVKEGVGFIVVAWIIFVNAYALIGLILGWLF